MQEEFDAIEQQGGMPEDYLPAFRRPQVYRGVAREVGWIALNAALWPVGLVHEAVGVGARRVENLLPAVLSRRRPPLESAAPIVLIHGYFHNRSGLMVMRRSLTKRGFPNVLAFSYNPIRKGIPELAECVGRRVDLVLEETGESKVHLVGHSLGGLLARYFVERLDGDDRVHSVSTLGTPHRGTMVAFAGRSPSARQMRPGSDVIRCLDEGRKPPRIPYFSYYSNLDALVVPSRSAVLDNGHGSRVTNVLVPNLGHLSLLISPELIAAVAANIAQVNAELDSL